MLTVRYACALVAALLLGIAPARAGTLQVEPATVEVAAPGAASTINLRNLGDAPMTVQIRMFRWVQSRGVETLEPTEAVVASPPAVELKPGADQLVRIVRVGKRPVEDEEAYRLIVDQLPSGTKPRSGAVRLLMRYSIPVFFGQPDRSEPRVAWSVVQRDGKLIVSARNSGDSRLRVSQLVLRDAKGRQISFGEGLVGYALGKSTMNWTAPARDKRFAATGRISVSGQGNNGPFDATASLAAR
jgi:fimbrial chaperone protein